MLSFDIDTRAFDRLRRRLLQAQRLAREELRKAVTSGAAVAAEEVNAVLGETGAGRGVQAVAAVDRIASSEVRGMVRAINKPGYPAELPAWMNDGTPPHEIRPKRIRSRTSPNRKAALKFPIGGTDHFAAKVQHPGTKPLRFMERGLERARPRIVRIAAGHLGVLARKLGSDL